MDHPRIAPGAAIGIEHLRPKTVEVGGTPAAEAGLVEEIRIVADHPLGERFGLGEEIPMPISAGDVPVRVHEHRVGRHDIHHGERAHDIGMIEREAMRGAAAAIMADDMEPGEAERLHQAELIRRHRAEGIGGVVGAQRGFDKSP